ncbi:Alpha/Beta hydrolase protein [Xylariaceae sp. FL0594]|nr:Alpha/Beta hydrolase protein [Xylariaceae sp. FL0594]
MAEHQTTKAIIEDLILPRRKVLRSINGETEMKMRYIPGPTRESLTTRFGEAFPAPTRYLESDLGITAMYDLGTGEPGPDEKGEEEGEEVETRNLLMIHGLNTPALGLVPLARAIQSQSQSLSLKSENKNKNKRKTKTKTHIILFDLWGHGHSSTPLAAHSAHIFHSQVYQVLLSSSSSSSSFMTQGFHILGFSFGGCLAAKFALYNPNLVKSVALVAPAGVAPIEVDLLTFLTSDEEAESQLQSQSTTKKQHPPATEIEKEKQREDKVLAFLEDSPQITLPPDWEPRMRRGELVAEALRQWELDEHAGYRQTVLSVFREEGNVFGAEAFFRRFAAAANATTTPTNKEEEEKKKKKGESFGKVLIILGGDDAICSEQQLLDLGFGEEEKKKKNGNENGNRNGNGNRVRIMTIEGADHALVRTHTRVIAKALMELWEE